MRWAESVKKESVSVSMNVQKKWMGKLEWLYCHKVVLYIYIFDAWYDLCCVAATIGRMTAEGYLEKRRECTRKFESNE